LDKAITALVGALVGAGGIYFGLRFHIGDWFIDGPWAYACSALGGALVALLVRYAIRKDYGLP
jgi:hypothetical protein